jgi:hypothetical protein
MNWLIAGTFPAMWRVFTDDGIVMAQGMALNQRRARKAIREYLDLVSA